MSRVETVQRARGSSWAPRSARFAGGQSAPPPGAASGPPCGTRGTNWGSAFAKRSARSSARLTSSRLSRTRTKPLSRTSPRSRPLANHSSHCLLRSQRTPPLRLQVQLGTLCISFLILDLRLIYWKSIFIRVVLVCTRIAFWKHYIICSRIFLINDCVYLDTGRGRGLVSLDPIVIPRSISLVHSLSGNLGRIIYRIWRKFIRKCFNFNFLTFLLRFLLKIPIFTFKINQICSLFFITILYHFLKLLNSFTILLNIITLIRNLLSLL